MTAAEPVPFREAVAAMSGASVRPEIELGPIRPPQRLAPYSYALGAEVKRPELDIVPERSDGDAFGRLILLYDPDGADAWDGTMRLVAYIQADLDSSEAVDPLLPEVAWSWLVEALEARAEHVTALGGTVTATTSVRYGDISGPPRAHQLELRASWTAITPDIGTHVEAFCEVLEHAAGLPPVGVRTWAPGRAFEMSEAAAEESAENRGRGTRRHAATPSRRRGARPLRDCQPRSRPPRSCWPAATARSRWTPNGPRVSVTPTAPI